MAENEGIAPLDSSGATFKARTPKKGMGFDKAAASVQKKQGVSAKAAKAIIAAGARKASPAAKRKNPNLKKVLPKKGK